MAVNKKRKILNHRDIRWQGKQAARLSYDMIFRDEEPGVDIAEGDWRETKRGRSGDEDPAGRLSDEGRPGKEVSTDEPEEKLFNENDLAELLSEKDREWKEKMENACKEAFQLGKKEGWKSGYEEAEARFNRISKKLEEGFERAHAEWKERARLLEPGLLDLVFEISEKILEHPAENPENRTYLDAEIGDLLQRLDETMNPVLWVSEEDLAHLEQVKEKVAPDAPVVLRTSDSYDPGEYQLETNREWVIREHRKMLEDFRHSLSLPSWKDE